MRLIKSSVICLSLAGCASYPQPTDSLATSVGAAQGAQEAGAEQLPDAALHLRLANEQNEKARRLMADEENERADFMAQRARSDADLALALAHEERARKRAHEANASLEKVQSPAAGQSAPSGQTP